MVAQFLIALLVSIALNIVAYLLQPKPKAPKPQAAKDMDAPTAEAGREMPVIFGTITIKSPNCLWWGDRTKNTFQVNA